MSIYAPEFEIVSDETRFLALEREWDALWARTEVQRYSHTFAWFRLGWETTGRPRGRRLQVLVMRRAGQTALIWPMTVRRRLVLWRVADALGPEFTEYAPLVVAKGPDVAENIAAAIGFMRRHGLVDLVNAPRVPQESPTHDAMSASVWARPGEVMPSPYISWEGYASWDAYWRARSKNTKSRVGRRSRRFAELGEVSFGLVEDPDEYERLLDWTLTEKVAWMARTGLDNDFMDRAEFRSFLGALGTTSTPHGRWVMFALRLNGRVVATKMGTLDDRRYEGFVAAQDPEFANYSAGSIILIKTLEWLFDRGLEYDFRIGHEPYKLEWATGDRPTTTFHIPTTGWGEAYLTVTAALQRIVVAKDRLREAVPQSWRSRLKAWLRSPLAAPADSALPEPALETA